MKHRWLEARYRIKEALEHGIRHIFDKFDEKYYFEFLKNYCV